MSEFKKEFIEKVTEGLYRGPRPSSYKDLEHLRDHEHQVLVIYNLQSGWFEFFHNDSYEREKDVDFGMIEKCLKLSDFKSPKAHELKTIVEDIKRNLTSGRVVYVHCKWGKDRTGMVCAAYRILQEGKTVNYAVNEMIRMGFHTFPYAFWIKQLSKLKRGENDLHIE